MRDYELVYIVRPNAGEEDLNGLNERVQGWITAEGGEIQKVTPWGRRRLAFTLRDFRDGLYVQVNFKGQPQGVKPLERNLKLSEDVMRYLLVRPGE